MTRLVASIAASIACLLLLATARADDSDKEDDLKTAATQMIVDVNAVIASAPAPDATTADREKFARDRQDKSDELFKSLHHRLSLTAKVDDVLTSDQFTVTFADPADAAVFSNAEMVAVFKVDLLVPVPPEKKKGKPPKPLTVPMTVWVAGSKEDFKEWRRQQEKTIMVRVFYSGGRIGTGHLGQRHWELGPVLDLQVAGKFVTLP